MSLGLPTEQEIRDYIKDDPESNKKFRDIVFPDSEIKKAKKWAEERISGVFPSVEVSPGEVPKYICLLGTLAQLFQIKYLNAMINYAPGMNENGISLPEGEDGKLFKTLSDQYDALFEQKMYQFKQKKTLKDSLTSIPSPYQQKRGPK